MRSAINGPITLGFPARPQPVRLARLVSAAVAGSVDASIDDIEDLRIAVGEACAILVGHATTDGRVEITIAVGSDSMTFDSRLTGGRCDDPRWTSWRNWFWVRWPTTSTFGCWTRAPR